MGKLFWRFFTILVLAQLVAMAGVSVSMWFKTSSMWHWAPGQQGAPARQGLGLAIAKQVVDAHGGSITARNRGVGGLCVEIRLPIKGSELGRLERAAERSCCVC